MNISRKSFAIVSIAVAALSVGISVAQDKSVPDAAQHKATTSASSAESGDTTSAEVRKVDKEGKKITLKHEAIKSLDMPGMTMVFKVKDATLLDNVKAGDKVKFRVITESGAYIVTELLPAK